MAKDSGAEEIHASERYSTWHIGVLFATANNRFSVLEGLHVSHLILFEVQVI